MKNLIIFLCICTCILNGCTLKDEVWRKKYYQDSFINYFIDDSRVVLIGQNKKAYNGRDNYHYVLDDMVGDIVNKYKSNKSYRHILNNINCPSKFGNIKKVFEIATRSEGLSIQLSYPQATGEKILVRNMILKLNKSKLLQRDLDYLYQNNFKDTQNNLYVYQDCPVKMVRYPASNEKSIDHKNGFIIPNYERTIWENNTPLQLIGKSLLTPFAIAADIVLLPITLPIFIHQQVKDSQTMHFCEGEFCGYDKLKIEKSK